MLRWCAWPYIATTPRTTPAVITNTPVLKTKSAATRHSGTCSVSGMLCCALCAALFTAARATSLPTPLPQLARCFRSNAMLGSEARPMLGSEESWLGATLVDTSPSLVSGNDCAEHQCRQEVAAASPRADCALPGTFPPRGCVCSVLLYMHASATLRRCTAPALLPGLRSLL